MRFGIHLPQYGGASGADSIRRAAIQAESLGFDDVWVSDHVAVPSDASYPPPYLYDPFTTLTWAAAATERVRLGTSILVLPQHATVAVANTCASLDALSGGRVLLGVGAGWLEGEFRALGASFEDRGARLDEAIDVLRACWQSDPTDHQGRFHRIESLRVLPKPAAGRVPIWVGGHGERAFRRGTEKGDGFHALGKTPEEMADLVTRLRRARPEEAFTISLRRGWGRSQDRPERAARRNRRLSRGGRPAPDGRPDPAHDRRLAALGRTAGRGVRRISHGDEPDVTTKPVAVNLFSVRRELIAEALGTEQLVLASWLALPGLAHAHTDASLIPEVVRRFDAACEHAAARGLRIGFHNHHFE